MTKYNIDENSFLTGVKRYDLDRGKNLGYLRIEVHRVLAGSEKVGLFIAFPTQFIIDEADKRYSSEGKSEEEALAKCLDLVKGVPNDEIFSEINELDDDTEDSNS